MKIIISKKKKQISAKAAYTATKAYTQEQMQAFREETETELDEYKKDIDQMQAEMEVIMEDKRKAYEEKLDAQLKEWNAQIALLKTRAENAKADAKVDYYKTIEALENKQEKAKTKLQELKTAGDEAWDAVKTGAEKAWAEVMTAYHDAVSKFK